MSLAECFVHEMQDPEAWLVASVYRERSRRHVFSWLAQASLLIKIAFSSLFANTGFPISVLLPKKVHCEIDADDSSAKVTSHHITSCHITSTQHQPRRCRCFPSHSLGRSVKRSRASACGVRSARRESPTTSAPATMSPPPASESRR